MSSFETQVWQRPRVRRADLCLYGRRLRCRRLLWHPVYRQIVGVRGVCSVFKKPILFKVPSRVPEKSAGQVLENRRLNLSVKNVEIVGRMSVIQENVRTCDLLCAKALLSGFHTFKTACAGSLWLLRCCSSKLAIPRNAV